MALDPAVAGLLGAVIGGGLNWLTTRSAQRSELARERHRLAAEHDYQLDTAWAADVRSLAGRILAATQDAKNVDLFQLDRAVDELSLLLDSDKDQGHARLLAVGHLMHWKASGFSLEGFARTSFARHLSAKEIEELSIVPLTGLFASCTRHVLRAGRLRNPIQMDSDAAPAEPPWYERIYR